MRLTATGTPLAANKVPFNRLGGGVMRHNTVVFLPERKKPSREDDTLERLFTKHSHALRLFLRARLGNSDAAEDALQDVFFRLAQIECLAERLREEKGSVRSYLFTIANNLVIDQARQAAVRQKYLQNQVAEESVYQITLERELIGAQDVERLKVAIVNLKPKFQRAFLLSRFEHWSYSRIAEEMGVSVKTVEYYISKALAALKKEVRK